MNHPTDFLLVGISESVVCEDFVHEKLDTYLANQGGVRVILLDDVRGILRSYFGDRVIDSLSTEMPLTEKRLLTKYSRAGIFFWDGTSLGDYVYLALATKKPIKIIAVSTTRVANKDNGEQYDVYIGRGTPWGNPFAIGQDGMDRAAVIRAYSDYFKKRFVDDPNGARAIRSLRGKVLGCHCKPEACHGDVIASYLNSFQEDADGIANSSMN